MLGAWLFSGIYLQDILLAALDISIVAYLLYRVLLVIKDTRAFQILIGLLLVTLLGCASEMPESKESNTKMGANTEEHSTKITSDVGDLAVDESVKPEGAPSEIPTIPEPVEPTPTEPTPAVKMLDVAAAKKQLTADQLALGDPVVNSVGMLLVPIPAGDFQMGSPNSDGNARSGEKPQHPVKITKPFYLGVYEVTQDQYEKVMEARPWQQKKYVKEGPDYPAAYVTWANALEFCRKLSEEEGVEYFLPTEAQTEARAHHIHLKPDRSHRLWQDVPGHCFNGSL